MAGRELVDWGVMGFRQSDLTTVLEEFKRRLENLILRCQPHVLAVETPALVRLRSSAGLEAIVRQCEYVAKAGGLLFRAYGVADIRIKLCSSPRATLGQVAEQVIAHHPHLSRYRTRSSKWQALYWAPMFTAVAVALACSQDLGDATFGAESAVP